MNLNLWPKTIGFVLSFLVLFVACDDNIGNMGYDMLPDSDKATVKTSYFDVTTKSILSGPVFARSSTGFLGRFIDPEFGEYETSFLTELNCLDSLSFPSVYSESNKEGIMAGDTTHLTELILYYSEFYGDSTSQSRLNVYTLDEKLEANYYTDINPDDYYDETKPPLVSKTFTPIDYSYSDSIIGLEDFYPHVRVELPKEFGENILKANREHPEYFYSSEAFINNILKGLYIKTVEGDGAILYIDRVQLNVVVACHYKDSLNNSLQKVDGTDSLYYAQKTFPATREVIQANSFKNSDKLQEKVAETEHTFLKSPAGIFTEMTIPFDEIEEQLISDTLNLVKLVIPNYYEKSDYPFKMNVPSNILLVRKDDMFDFFKENKIGNNIDSYEIAHNSVKNTYTFDNLNRLVQTVVNEKNNAKKEAEKADGTTWTDESWNKKWAEDNPDWNKLVLIPIIAKSKQTGNNTTATISVEHDLRPGCVKLKGGDPEQGGNKLSLEVVHSTFNR